MIVITTTKFSTTIPERVLPGQALTASEAALLQRLFTQRMRALAAYWLDKMPPEEVQIHLQAEAESFSFATSDRAPQDPVTGEAIRIAGEIVRARVAQAGFSYDDSTLDHHIAEVAKLESVRRRAAEIITLRRQTALKALNQ